MKLCDYGCGNVAKYKFKNGKLCCKETWQKCPINIRMRSINHKGLKHSKPVRIEERSELCNYGCGNIAKYKFKNGKLCCSENISNCKNIIKDISKKISMMRNDPKSIYNTKEFKNLLSKVHKGKKQDKDLVKRRIKASVKTMQLMSKKERIKKYGRPRTVKMLQERYPFFCVVEEIREDLETGQVQVRCKNHNCPNSKEMGGWFTPTYRQIEFRLLALETVGVDNSYFYCCNRCKKECPLFGLRSDLDPNRPKIDLPYTSEEYEIFRQEVLRRQKKELGYNECELCGVRNSLQIHHEKPKKLEPGFSLDPDNGIVLCGSDENNCHNKFGHKDNCSTGRLSTINCKE